MKSPVASHFDTLASSYDEGKLRNSYYYSSLISLLRRYIPYNRSVLEIGCGTGELLSHLNPSKGVGIDISENMIAKARKKYTGKNMTFRVVSIEKYSSRIPFDTIFMADVIEHLTDPVCAFASVEKLMKKHTTFVITMANPIWEPVLMFAEKLHLKMPEGPHNRIAYADINRLCRVNDMHIIHHSYSTLCPVNLGIVSSALNNYCEPFLRRFAFIEFFIIKKGKIM